MNLRSCAQVREQLALFVGGDLAVAPADAVRVHLMSCRTCRSEAAALQQASAALRELGRAPVPGVDDRLFAAMHRTIVATVADGDGGALDRARLVRRWAVAAAAVLLAAVGFWWGRGEPEPSVWRRSPLSTPVALDAPVIVVPYAGPRVELRPLGDEWWPEWAQENGLDRGAVRPGMGGRLQLRSLVDEGALLPEQPPRPR